MSEATPARFSIDFQQAGKSGNTASVAYNDPDEALRAYKDAAESFRASKQPPGASLSLNDQALELRAGVVSEGKGVVRHAWQHDAARERFDSLRPSSEPRPELDTMRQAFIDTGKVSEFPAAKSVTGAPELSHVPDDWAGPASTIFDREMGVRMGDPSYSKAQEVASMVNRYREMSFEPSPREQAILAERKDAIADARDWIRTNVLYNPTVKAEMYETVRDMGRETGDPVGDAQRRAYLAEMEAGLSAPAAVRASGKVIVPVTSGGSIEAVEPVASKPMAGREAHSPPGAARTDALEGEKIDSLRKRYLRTPAGYHDKQTMELVIATNGNKLVTQREDTATIDALAVAVHDRGWSSVAITGTEAFRREAWYQLTARGIEVSGYTPTPVDKARLADVQHENVPIDKSSPARASDEARRALNTATKVPDKSTERTSAQAAPVARPVSPIDAAAKAVRDVADEISPAKDSSPRDGLAVSAAANAAYGAAVATNERALAQQQPGARLKQPSLQSAARAPLTGDKAVMVEAVVRVAREGGLDEAKLNRVREAATQVAGNATKIKAPKVADRSAIPQPVASSGPKQNAKRDLSR